MRLTDQIQGWLTRRSRLGASWGAPLSLVQTRPSGDPLNRYGREAEGAAVADLHRQFEALPRRLSDVA
ncbi:hypothetical protein D9M68_988070 [compost metagenome]